jgi:hypothetical protein
VGRKFRVNSVGRHVMNFNFLDRLLFVERLRRGSICLETAPVRHPLFGKGIPRRIAVTAIQRSEEGTDV